MNTKIKHIALSGLFIASFLLSSNLSISSTSAATASITTNTGITLDASSAGNGVSIDEESISITTTCTKGYDLTIATSTSTDLYLDGDSTKSASYTAVDGTSALDSANNTNKWGYTTATEATSSTVFSPLSTAASSIRTISETTDVTSETIPIYYGIKTDNTIDPGTYTMGNNGTIIYYLTMNPLCDVVDIAYDGNNADAGTMGTAGTGVIHTGVKDGDTVNLVASNFSRDGYGFAGWSLDPDAGVKLLDNDGTNNPVVYGPQESVTLPEGFINNDTDNDGIVKLYAVWLQSQGSLQGWIGCNTLDIAAYDSTTGALDFTKNSVTALTDQRDNDTYAVARLADGNCWMIENLRLDNTAEYNSDGALAQGYGGQFVGLASPETADKFSDVYSANSLYSNDGVDNTANLGTSDTAYRMPRYSSINTPENSSDRPQNPMSGDAANPVSNAGIYSYGNYYTWAAAVANTATYAFDSQSVTTTSICPAGWHLPKGGNKANEANNDYWSLIVTGINNGTNPVNYESSAQPYYTGSPEGADVSNAVRAYPNNFVYSGAITNGSLTNRGSIGNYWSSTTYNNSNAYNLHINSSDVYPGASHNNKYYGRSVRCAVPGNIYSVHFDANTTDTVTGVMADQSIEIDKATQLRRNAFQRSGYRFVGWNTEPDGSGDNYANGASVTNLAAIGQSITLYAQWSPVLTINFDSNGGTGTMASQLIPENTSQSLSYNRFVAPSGNYFIGWMTEESRANNEVVYTDSAIYTTPATITPGESITLYAKWGPKYTIIYDGNNATGGTMVSNGAELKHAGIKEGERITNLYAPNYWKANYSFVGWSPSPTATVGDVDPIYGPNESILAPDYDKYGEDIDNTKTVKLYAIWLEADSTKTMQTFTAEDCQNLSQITFDAETGKIAVPAGSVIALKDQRDNNVYTVARLADGKCWMTENLRLEAENTVGNNQFDSSITNRSLSQGYGGVFVGLDSSEDANFSNATSATPNSLYNSSKITGTMPEYRFPRYNNNNTNTSLAASYNGTVGPTYYSWYSYGNYYTWAAAMANTTYYADAFTSPSESESANTSICPTNWMLPTSGPVTGNYDYGTLSKAYGGTGDIQGNTSQSGDIMSGRLRSFPNNFIYSGVFGDSYPESRGSYGYYWSRSSYNGSGSFSLNLNSTSLHPLGASDKYYGFSVRCLVGS